ncbi:MAG: hypothetical protein JW976_06520 [Syntrophaceae bacterium]|nr:hypothetical protein [Syntrophaceae bacterium]
MKNFSIIIFFAITWCLVTFYLSGSSVAEQKDAKECISSCEYSKRVCLNMNPDRRLCESEFQNCLNGCKSPEESSSKTEQKQEQKLKKQRPT